MQGTEWLLVLPGQGMLPGVVVDCPGSPDTGSTCVLEGDPLLLGTPSCDDIWR